MGVSSAIFESAGKRTEHFVPGVYSRDFNVSSGSGVSSGNLCILGQATGGKPLSLYEFGSIAEAKKVLIDGELLKAISYAFNGSNDYIPQKVFAMRVNSGTQSQLVLKSGDNVIMTIKAWDYGAHTNQLNMKLTSNTDGSKKISFNYKDTTVDFDNIIKKSIAISSTLNSASINISSDSLTITGSYTDDNEETQTINETISFEDFPKLTELVSKINTIYGCNAVLEDTDENALSSNLDVTNATLSSSSVVLESTYKEIVKTIKDCEFVSEVIETDNRFKPTDILTPKYFTGGNVSSASNEDWINALSVLETEDIQIISTPETSPAIQTFIAAHCSLMSTTVNRKERTCILGGGINETDESAISNASGFNNKLVSYVTDNAITSNPLTGETETINGAMLAVMLAGMEAAMSVNMPLTNKTLKVLEFTKKRTITNLEKLIKGGVLVCNASPDDVKNMIVIRGITTYQSDDLISNERSMVREALYMNRELRHKFAKSIGMPNNARKSMIISTLKDAAKDWADLGYIVPNDNNENVWNYSVRIDGDKIYLTYSRYLTAPTNFIFITATNHIYTTTMEV